MSAPACRRKTGGAEADASPAARCLELPGAYRRELHASADRKTLYFLERAGSVEYKNVLGTAESRASYDLMQVSTNGGTAKKIASDVVSFAVASTGDIVFTHPVNEGKEYERANGLYVLRSSGQRNAIDIPDGGARSVLDGVTSFVNDDKGKQTLFVAAEVLYAVPLTGGEPKKIGPADVVWGVTPDGNALVRTLAGTEAIALDGSGRTTRIGSDGFSLRTIGDRLVFVSRSPVPIPLQSMPVAGGTAASVPWSKADDGFVNADGARIFARRLDGERATLVAGDLVAASTILETEDASFDGAVDLDARTTAVLVHWDTDGRAGFGSDDESDICVLLAGHVAVPSRHFAKKDAADGVALAKAARGDLAGAKIALRHSDGYDVAVFNVPTDGTIDPEALRQRAKTLQAEVAKLTGRTTLGASIEFKNAVSALAYVHPGAPTTVLLSGGKKGHLQDVREQYDVELDPGILHTTDQYGSETGRFTCRGSVKNRGPAPLTVQIRCSVHGLFEEHAESATTPATIAPGATGKYDFYAGTGKKTDRVTTLALQNGRSIPYFNAYADRKSKEAK